MNKTILMLSFFLAAQHSHAEPTQELLNNWAGRFKLKSCDICDPSYRLEPAYTLRNLTGIEVTIDLNSAFPVCVERVFEDTQQRTNIGNCFTLAETSGDTNKLTLLKNVPDLFNLKVELTRTGQANEVQLSINRVTNPAIKKSPFGESANLKIGVTVRKEINQD